MNLWDPTQWADAGGFWVLLAVCAGTVVLVAVKIAGVYMDDWLDERLGRGSIRDDWPDRAP